MQAPNEKRIDGFGTLTEGDALAPPARGGDEAGREQVSGRERVGQSWRKLGAAIFREDSTGPTS
jgi:hypothetical protein